MSGGLRYDSLADVPVRMRKQVAAKILPRSLIAAPTAEGSRRESKYHNSKVAVNGIHFDSRKEARRYQQLMDACREGVITDLRLQVDFTLQEAYTTADGERIQAIRYKADFTYKVIWGGEFVPTGVSFEDLNYWRARTGERVIEDVKSAATRTRVYINKYKMMADMGYMIREV